MLASSGSARWQPRRWQWWLSQRVSGLSVRPAVSLLPADSVRTMISYPWLTGTYRSSSSAYCRRLIERFGAAWPFIPPETAQGSGLQDRRLLKKGIRKAPDVALLPNPAVYENQGGAARGAAGPAPAPPLSLGRPARRAPCPQPRDSPPDQHGHSPRTPDAYSPPIFPDRSPARRSQTPGLSLMEGSGRVGQPTGRVPSTRYQV